MIWEKLSTKWYNKRKLKIKIAIFYAELGRNETNREISVCVCVLLCRDGNECIFYHKVHKPYWFTIVLVSNFPIYLLVVSLLLFVCCDLFAFYWKFHIFVVCVYRSSSNCKSQYTFYIVLAIFSIRFVSWNYFSFGRPTNRFISAFLFV